MIQNAKLAYHWNIFYTALLGCVFSLFAFGVVFAGLFEIKPFDSIAGYGTEIKISNANANQDVKVYIQPPSGELFVDTDSVDISGKLSYIVDPQLLTKSGVYTTSIVEQDQSYADGVAYQFEIFPDDPSSDKSQIIGTASTQTGKRTRMTIRLVDVYMNPISGHRIELFSDRDEDRIIPVSVETTNADGEVDFYITSYQPGVSTLTARDTSYDITFFNTHSLRFYADFLDSSGLSGDLTASAIFGDISKFKVDFPTTVFADDDANYMTVTAIDDEGKTIQDYEGTIKIVTPTEDNSLLPGEDGVYEFTEKDQGTVTFSRSLIFPEEGTHKLEVYEYDKKTDDINTNIFGKITVEVEQPKIDVPTTKTPVTITTPSQNSDFSNSDISVTGTALPNSDVKIVLDENPVVEAPVSAKGNYSALLKNVADGDHSLYVYQKEDKKSVSDTLEFSIDTKASSIISAQFEPVIAKPQEDITVTIEVENAADVDEIVVSWTGGSTILKSVGKNTYQSVFKAPLAEGKYTLEATLKDDLKNTTKKTLSPSLTVAKETNITPTENSITGLTGEYDPKKEEVMLEWDALTPNPLLYIIHSGNTKTKLEKIKSVSGKTPKTNISNLKDGEYFFSVSAVGSDGSEGSKSSVISVTVAQPTPTPTPSTPTPTPTPTPNTPTPTPIPTKSPDPELFVSPAVNALNIRWQKTENTSKYILYYGIAPKTYAANKEFSSLTSSTTLPDLIPGVAYYVGLEALDANGTTLFSYTEKIGIPMKSSFHPAAGTILPYPTWVTETGPQFFLVLGGLFCIASAWIFTRREDEYSIS